MLQKTPYIAILLLCFFFSTCQKKQPSISYNDHIRPIFNNKCLPCHGGIKQLGGFSLLFPEEALDTTKTGVYAIVPGKHKRSELFKRITHHDPELRMPQEAEPLTENEIKLIKTWIDEGAQWENHWAFVAPEMPIIPKASNEWIKKDLDQFVWHKLQELGLEPEQEADRRTLIRRLSLDLTGLPPTPEQVNTFLNDESPDAYEQLVDRLLASPHFGERWAAMWLDLARYADTKGYEKDPYRNIWKYRDWVIHAFNQDLPFDQFTTHQLAGDLLPEPTQDQLIATAFHRNTMTNTEGGTDDEEYRVVALIDRVNTTFEVWQATTMACVQCHSHPYDPFRQEDYYQLMAFFDNTLDNDLETDFPLLETYSTKDIADIKAIIRFIEDLQPATSIKKEIPLAQQVEQALFPRLFPQDVDDIQHVMLTGGGDIGNGSYNAKDGEGRKYYFKYENIDLTDLEGIEITYFTEGNDARLEVRKDSPDGNLLASETFVQTWGAPLTKTNWSERFETLDLSLTKMTGSHDLVFEIINTTGKAPEGLVWIREIFLKYKDFEATPAWKEKTNELLGLRWKAQKTPIMQSKSAAFKRKTHVFERGNWLMKGEEVSPKIPDALPQIAQDSKPDRLDFAEWLVDEKNPLTARVMANRLWEQLFGNGLVATLEDFGTQGQLPTHPELLDYLALRFSQNHKWSVKALLKEMVLSATYRQSSRVTAEKTEKDPYNIWLSRGPRFRLSAEQLRDQALAVSGLLKDTIGGPSVMPPQPEGVWQVVYSSESWKTSEADRYRRGLYTFWKRTAPYPSMVAFDSPSREFCVSRRIRTNTPLQALVTLNDPVYLEAAQALARQMEKDGGNDLEASITAGYKRALAQEPDQQNIDILKQLYKGAQEELSAKEGQARLISQTEEPAISLDPMTVVASAILNLDAFLTKN